MDSWQLQVFTLFLLFSSGLMAAFSLFRPLPRPSRRRRLMKHARAMVGRHLKLDSDLRAGRGEAWLGGARWSLRARQQLAGGVQVEVFGTDGLTLLVRPSRCSVLMTPDAE